MIAVDTSVVVAGVSSWHVAHAVGRSLLVGHPRLPAHCSVEVFSVLTRLPPPHRVGAEDAWLLLAAAFPAPYLTLPASEHRRLLQRAAAAGVRGGAVYDALVGATAARAGATLVTRDRRAATTYERMGVTFEVAE